MNKTEAIKLLTRDVAAWNKYRDQNREWLPDLRGANLGGANLEGADLWGANLWGANLWGAKLTRSQVQPWIGEPDWQDEA